MRALKHVRLLTIACGLGVGALACVGGEIVGSQTGNLEQEGGDGNGPPLPSGSQGLVACPSVTSTSASAIVTILGGSVLLGQTGITLPAGAVTLPTLLSVTLPVSSYAEVDIKANDLESFLFQRTVTVSIDYSRCPAANVDDERLMVWYIDPATKRFLENMGGTDNKAAKRITFTTDHLSSYAIAH